MSYPKDRLLDERPEEVDVLFEGDEGTDLCTGCDVSYESDPTERDGWRVLIENSCWKARIVGEDLEKGTAGMVLLEVLEDYESGAPVGDRQYAELTWPATARSQN
jgi:hypothetical protein